MPQLKYCRSYSRECGKRSACGGGGGRRRWGGRRPAAVAPGGWRQGWYWIWWYPGSDAAADYRYHPLIRPPRFVRHTLPLSPLSLNFSLSLSLFADMPRDDERTRNTHAPTHVPPHSVSTPAFHTFFLRRDVAAAHVLSPAEGWCIVLCFLRLLPSLPSLRRKGERDGTSRVPSLCLWFFSLFLCGALNRLLVRTGVYSRTTIGNILVCM